MDQRSPTCETSLLSRAGWMPDLDWLSDELTEILADFGEQITRIERIEKAYHIAQTESVQVLLVVSSDPLPLDGLMKTLPQGRLSDLKGEHLLDRMSQISATTTVIVMPRADATNSQYGLEQEEYAEICHAITEALIAPTGAELIFCADTDALHEAGEFGQQNIFGTINALGPQNRFATEPMLSAQQQDWLENGQAKGFNADLWASARSVMRWFRTAKEIPAEENVEKRAACG